MGTLCFVYPNIDKANPSEIIETFRKCTAMLFGSPAFCEKLALYAKRNNLALPAQCVAVGGAPIFKNVLRAICDVTSKQLTFVYYGCTEAEPISAIAADEKMKLEVGEHMGLCVGKPVFEGTVKIIQIVEGRYGVYMLM